MQKRSFISMNKKSQAALEFLTTYAWAFLVIIIMIAALAYFGILQPSKILPSRCNFGSEIRCVDYRIDDAGTFNLRLQNNLGEPIVIGDVVTGIALSSGSTVPFACTGARSIDGTATGAYTWNSDKTIDMSFTSCNPSAAGFVVGEKAKALITISYHLAKTSAAYTRQISGEVFTAVT